MTSPSDMGSAFLRFVHEALGSLAAPAVRDSVIGGALKMATDAELPVSPLGFQRFVRGPLRAAMLDAFGPEVTDSVSVELEHVVMLSSRPGELTATQRPPPSFPRPAQVPGGSSPFELDRGCEPDEAPDLAPSHLGSVRFSSAPLSGNRQKARPDLKLAAALESDGTAS